MPRVRCRPMLSERRRIKVWCPPRSLHAVERLLKKREVAGLGQLFASRIDPAFLKGVFRWSVVLIKHAEHAREWELGQFVRCKFIRHVVTHFVFRRVVVLFLLDHGERTAFPRISWIEGAGVKFDTLTQALD